MSAVDPDVAVIVPTYNARSTIDAALGSIVGQSVQPREVVVVDDGSRDGTVECVRRWETLLPLRVVEMPVNGGPGRARNEGVRRSAAPLIAFLDADDVWFPNHLAACLDLQASTGGVVTGRALWWNEDIGILPRQDADDVSDVPREQNLASLVRHHTFGMHAVIPRAVFEQVGGFDHTYEGVEDWDLWIRIAAAGVPLARTMPRTFLYRQHTSNLSLDVDRVGEAGLRLLDRLEREQRPLTKELRAAIRSSRALIAFNRASARLSSGDHLGARRQAMGAMTGPPSLAMRAVAIAVAPKTYAKARERRGHGDPAVTADSGVGAPAPS